MRAFDREARAEGGEVRLCHVRRVGKGRQHDHMGGAQAMRDAGVVHRRLAPGARHQIVVVEHDRDVSAHGGNMPGVVAAPVPHPVDGQPGAQLATVEAGRQVAPVFVMQRHAGQTATREGVLQQLHPCRIVLPRPQNQRVDLRGHITLVAPRSDRARMWSGFRRRLWSPAHRLRCARHLCLRYKCPAPP